MAKSELSGPLHVNGTVRLAATQSAAEADTAAATATAIAATVDAATAGSIAATVDAATASAVGDTVSVQNTGWGATAEADADALHTEIDATIVDVAAILVWMTEMDLDYEALLVDVAANRTWATEMDLDYEALLVDVNALRVTLNSLLAKLRTNGIIAT